MPITSSAKKALRASKKKRVFNVRRKSSINAILKEFRAAVAAKNASAAEKSISTLYQTVDKAAKTGYLKPNAAARMKSRAMAAIKRISK